MSIAEPGSAAERLLDSARVLFARHGPDGVSVRQLAAGSGCTHALLFRHFGSKADLERIVVERLATDLAAAVGHAVATSVDPVRSMLAVARRSPVETRLLVRCGLGDLDPSPLTDSPRAADALIGSLGPEARSARSTMATRIARFAGLSVLLGWISFEGFLVAGSRLGPISETRRETALADAARRIVGLAADGVTIGRSSRTRRSVPVASSSPPPPVEEPKDARAALLDAAMTLFALHGSGTVTTRQIALAAGVNLGLIHRHFGSRAALISEAINEGTAPLMPAVMAAQGFDVDSVVSQVRHTSLAPRLIARVLVEGIDITLVRERFPVQRQLLAAYRAVPRGAGTGDLTDPRLAVAAGSALVLGSAIWDRPLRIWAGIDHDVDLDPAITTLTRAIFDLPTKGPG
jgi:TetR/AcrR family transcriptional regulator, repressor for neighboring sulfatase